jgi:hypothetical protein
VERVLEATRELFGERVHRPPSRCQDARLLLATIAEIYTQRYRLNMPARVAYYRLKNQIAPDPAFLNDPVAHLPPSFLEAIGLRLPPEPPQEEPEAQEGELQAAGEAEADPPHPSLALPTGREGKITIAQAWDTARETLRLELPGHVFRQRVEDLILLCFDPERYEFTLAATDAKTAAWLNERLARRLARVLCGVCDQTVGVKFTARDEKPDTVSTE